MIQIKNKKIILFDGVCNLCNDAVNFIIKHDKNTCFLFASLQSDAAKEILLQFPSKKNDLSTILYFDDGTVYEKSTAIFQIIRILNPPVSWLYVFIFVPKFIRDSMYKYVVKNRYQWFGKKSSCLVPNSSIEDRFLI